MVARFLQLIKYSVSGTTSFLIDLGLLYALTEELLVPYFIAVPLSFLVAVTIHYTACRVWVFPDTARSLRGGYILFLGVLASTLVIIEILVIAQVEIFNLDVIAARVVSSFFAGLWSYLLNARITFRC